MGQIFDWDGTITGIPKAMIVRDQPFYVSSLCESRPNWGNMSICPHQYVSAEGTGSGYQKTSIIDCVMCSDLWCRYLETFLRLSGNVRTQCANKLLSQIFE